MSDTSFMVHRNICPKEELFGLTSQIRREGLEWLDSYLARCSIDFSLQPKHLISYKQKLRRGVRLEA